MGSLLFFQVAMRMALLSSQRFEANQLPPDALAQTFSKTREPCHAAIIFVADKIKAPLKTKNIGQNFA
jgi:hypothetical protein